MNKENIPDYCDYFGEKNIFLTRTFDNSLVFIHIHKGEIILKTKLPKDGPDAIRQIIDFIFDEITGEVIILTQKGLKKIDNKGTLTHHCTFDYPLEIFSGFDSHRIIPYNSFYIIAALNQKEIDLGIGSKEFIENATPIKFIDKNNCKLISSLNYPTNTILRKGTFQPIFYEPIISLDSENEELEFVFFQVESTIQRYDLNKKIYINSIGINLKGMDFPKPIKWEEKKFLQGKFQLDQTKGKIYKIINFMGNTLLAYRKSQIEEQLTGKALYYKIINNQGDLLGHFQLNDFSEYDFIIDHHKGNHFLAFPDFESFETDPIGYPIKIIRLNSTN